MLSTSSEAIIVFVIVCTVLILALMLFIALIVYQYQQKQFYYFKKIEEIKISHDNALLASHAEIQEQTFQNISREIHDNIGQKLTLSKLYLNLLDFNSVEKANMSVKNSVSLISEVIVDLSDISRGISSEIVLNDGLIHAIEYEMGQLEKSELFKLDFQIKGDSIFLDYNTELVLFRIVQESLNNIIKHAEAGNILIKLDYEESFLNLLIEDNGVGFNKEELHSKGAGLNNMTKRAMLMDGQFTISSELGVGTKVSVQIPLNEKTLKQSKSLL